MPIYAYQCDNCGETLDRLQKMSDPALTTCPACNQESLQRMLTAPNFRLSGSGWYETDFKKDQDKQKNLTDYKKEDKKPSDDNKPDAKKSDSSKETKSETKSTSTSSSDTTASAKTNTSTKESTR